MHDADDRILEVSEYPEAQPGPPSQAYEPPRLERFGTIWDATHGAPQGSTFDVSFDAPGSA